MRIIICRPKTLPPSQAEIAVRRSIEINPANAAEIRTVVRTPVGRRGGQRRLALLVGSRWPKTGKKLTVQFLDTQRKDLRKRIVSHLNAWNQSCNIEFVETGGVGLVRIARLDSPVDMAGYWSYVGTQILGVKDDEPTMNLEGFTMRVSEEEFRRVVRHEAGHTLGFEHEHMRSALVKKIDRQKAFEYFDETEGWTKEETTDQVLTPLAKKSIIGTKESDPLSIMCYQIPAEITLDGEPILGGADINQNDFDFAAKVYPKAEAGRQPSPASDVAAASVSLSSSAPVVVGAVPLQPSSQSLPIFPTAASGPDGDTLHVVVMDDFDTVRGQRTGAKEPKFARIFASYGGARVTAPMRLRADKDEPPTAFGRIIGTHERIKKYTNRQKGTLPSDKELIGFGTDLFEALFQGDVRRLYDEARSRQQNRKLDIVLTSMIPWIAEKPWEFAYDAGRQSFLATEEIHLVRNVLTAVPGHFIPPRSGPLRILVAAAQPVGMGALSIEQEVEVIRRGFQPLVEAGLVEIEVLARATPRRLQACMSTGHFTVVHMIGHGAFDQVNDEGALYFEDDQGGQFALRERSVREIFCKRGVSLVFLNSCESGSGGRNNPNKGVAQSLVSHGLPAVVANQYSVLDSSATSFAQHFYWSLASGMSVGQAACEWWPEGQKPPVVIFSCAGFDDLAPAGPETDRAIANVMVMALAGFYGDTGTHAKGAQDCPLAFNEERVLSHLIGPQKFDSQCRAKLKRVLKEKLPALDELLKTLRRVEQTMAKSKRGTAKQPAAVKKTAKQRADGRSAAQRRRHDVATAAATLAGPVTLKEAKALAQAQAPLRTMRRNAARAEQAATHESVAQERKKLEDQVAEENERRITEYRAVMSIMESRGVRGLSPAAAPPGRRAGAAATVRPPRIFAEGDSWFDYPVPLFGGGVVPRLERRLGVPILSLAKAGDEVRNMMGVAERKILSQQLRRGSPTGEPWDALLFSGGGNDIVGNPMALWVEDFDASVAPINLISRGRFAAALNLVKAGYEDLIRLRDTLSPTTHLFFHGYDFAIPDGRGICGIGPWLKPTFDLRGFPGLPSAIAVVKGMLQQFAIMLGTLASSHNDVTFINTQGTLTPVTSSWHNELHPSRSSFNQIAAIFQASLKSVFPGRLP